MNIVYPAPSKIPSRAANSVHVMKMCNAFAGALTYSDRRAETDGTVTLVVAEDPKTEPDAGNVFDYYGVPESFKIKRAKLKLRFIKKYDSYRYAVAIARCVSKGIDRENDIIYSRDPVAAYILACHYNLPVYLEWHTSFSPKSLSEKMFRKLVKSGNFVAMTVITEALKEYYTSKYAVSADKIITAPDGADAVPPDTEPASLITESKDKLNIGYIGHLYKGRGIEHLGQIAQMCPFAFFHIIGGNDKDIGFWKNEYRGFDNIHFYGYIPHSQTAAYGIAMDVLIAPYQQEIHCANVMRNVENNSKFMSPLKLFEYMSMGKPIICSDFPSLREVVTDEVNALLCTPDDAGAWARAIKRLHDDKKLSDMIAQNAYNEFLDKYTWDARARFLLEEITSRG